MATRPFTGCFQSAVETCCPLISRWRMAPPFTETTRATVECECSRAGVSSMPLRGQPEPAPQQLSGHRLRELVRHRTLIGQDLLHLRPHVLAPHRLDPLVAFPREARDDDHVAARTE